MIRSYRERHAKLMEHWDAPDFEQQAEALKDGEGFSMFDRAVPAIIRARSTVQKTVDRIDALITKLTKASEP